MSKRTVYLAVGSVVVLVLAGVAYGAATKIRWFDNIAEPNPDADGMAILNYASGQDKTIVQIIISDFEPDRTMYVNAYTVELVSANSAPTQDIETDHNGHGTLHWVLPGNLSDADINIYVNFGAENQELRATGTNPG